MVKNYNSSSKTNRTSGVLMHLTSLPGEHGIGDLGKAAYSFVDLLRKMGQRLWQILPLNPPDRDHNCPYNASSAFASNILLISLRELRKINLLTDKELDQIPQCSKDVVEFKKINPMRFALLRTAATRFHNYASKELIGMYSEFILENKYWLDDFAIYTHFCEKFDSDAWINWDSKIRSFELDSLQSEKNKYKESINCNKVLQFLFYYQWIKLKEYANHSGIKIIGDIPIYVSYNSSDVWSNQSLFKLNDNGKMIAQSGCPPDFFTSKGQLWGHPTYNWGQHEKSSFKWWVGRIKFAFKLVDIIRIDHFNGLEKYWEVPAADQDASNGSWRNAPGEKLLNEIYNEVGNKLILAENLGEAAKEVEYLLEKFNIPGMKIIQADLEGDKNFNNIDSRNVIYTGTHDNDTITGWFISKNKEINFSKTTYSSEQKIILDILGTDGSEINWDLIKMAFQSAASIAIIPMQDILGLDSESRMNLPGTVGNNWNWRFNPDMLKTKFIQKLNDITIKTGRL